MAEDNNSIHHTFDKPRKEELTIGNPKLELEWIMEGHLGFFMDRDKTNPNPTEILMDTDVYYRVVQSLLTSALYHLKGKINAGLQMTIEFVSSYLTKGVMVATYLKLQSVNRFCPSQEVRFKKRPAVPEVFVVPAPFALLISQLGRVKISGLDRELIVTPTVSDEIAERLCLPLGHIWSPTFYNQAVECAKALGMQFSAVDLRVKTGSTWWLYTHETVDDMFRITCPLPEENFTVETAALRTILCVDVGSGLGNNIFDLTPLGDSNYGSMCRNPPLDIALSTFFAVKHVNEMV